LASNSAASCLQLSVAPFGKLREVEVSIECQCKQAGQAYSRNYVQKQYSDSYINSGVHDRFGKCIVAQIYVIKQNLTSLKILQNLFLGKLYVL
jgi:hypothetical protein